MSIDYSKIKMTFPGLGVFTYAYSTCCGLLDSITYPNGKSVNYSYDDLKNLTAIQTPYKTFKYYTDEKGNRTGLFEEYGSEGHIPDGLRGKTLKSLYGYDGQNQLISAFYHNGYGEKYAYDALGNRERILTKHYEYAEDGTRMVKEELGITDIQGNVVMAFDAASGELQGRMKYDPWGNVKWGMTKAADEGKRRYDIYGYTGKEREQEIGLAYFGASIK